MLKSRDITLPTKFCLVKAMVFSVVMYGGESWTTKKGEHWSIDAFEFCYWRRLLRVPWIARRSNQSILKEIIPEYSLASLVLNLKLQYFGHLMRRADSLEKALILVKIEGGRRMGWQRMRWLWHHWLNGHEFAQAPGVGPLEVDSKFSSALFSLSHVWLFATPWTGKPAMLQSMG